MPNMKENDMESTIIDNEDEQKTTDVEETTEISDEVAEENTSSEEKEEAKPINESTEPMESEVVDDSGNIQIPNMMGGLGGLFGALNGMPVQKINEDGNPIGNIGGFDHQAYTHLFETVQELFEVNDQAHEAMAKSVDDSIANLISQLNNYKKNISWKLKALLVLNVISWVAIIVMILTR